MVKVFAVIRNWCLCAVAVCYLGKDVTLLHCFAGAAVLM